MGTFRAVISVINYGDMVLIGKKRSDSKKYFDAIVTGTDSVEVKM